MLYSGPRYDPGLPSPKRLFPDGTKPQEGEKGGLDGEILHPNRDLAGPDTRSLHSKESLLVADAGRIVIDKRRS